MSNPHLWCGDAREWGGHETDKCINVRLFVQAREWLTDEGPMDVPTLDGWRRYNLCVFALSSIYGNLKFDNRRWCMLVVL